MGIKYIQEGNKNKFQYCFNANSEDDFIEFNELPLVPVDLKLNNVYYYGYSFVDNDNAPSKLRTKFFNYLRFEDSLDKQEKQTFIGNALNKLHKEINLYDIDVLVYPQSRSKLNLTTIGIINKLVPNKKFIDIELIKKLPENIGFDFDAWKTEILTDDKFPGDNAKQQAINAVKALLEKIHNSDYFSIAESVRKNKYKTYIEPFLYFHDSNISIIKNAKLIFLLDDVATTGATIFSALKSIRSINHEAKIIVFTIIGKKEF